MYTVKDIAAMTKLTTRTIQNYLANGLLQGIKVGGQWRFTEEQVKVFFEHAAVSGQMALRGIERVQKALNQPLYAEGSSGQLITIFDIKQDEAMVGRLVEKISEHIQNHVASGLETFQYTYDKSVGSGRLILIGDIQVVTKLVALYNEPFSEEEYDDKSNL